MAKILSKGESVYECDECKRRTRVPTNRVGLDVVQRCTITANCRGKLHRLTATKDISETPAFPPEIAGVNDWFQRKVLHTHDQPVQSSTWRITHRLENKPTIRVYVQHYVNGTKQLVESTNYTARIVDTNTTELIFTQAEQGIAQCIASASQNNANPAASLTGVAAIADDFVVTVKGELTIATLSTLNTIDMSWTFNSPSQSTPIYINYSGVNLPSYISPWSGAKSVAIGGKRYIVRSFNVITTDPAPMYFSAGAITTGTTMAITNKPAPSEMLILLSTAPHESVDRVRTKYIDVANLNQPHMYYNDGEIYVPPSIIKSTYPPIIVD